VGDLDTAPSNGRPHTATISKSTTSSLPSRTRTRETGETTTTAERRFALHKARPRARPRSTPAILLCIAPLDPRIGVTYSCPHVQTRRLL
jgi:hypothetical protein